MENINSEKQNSRVMDEKKKELEENPSEFFKSYNQYFSQKEFLEIYDGLLEKYRRDFLLRIRAIRPNFREKCIYSVEHLLGQILKENVEQKDYKTFFEYQIYAFLLRYDKLHDDIKEYINNKSETDLYSDDVFLTNMNHLYNLIIDYFEVIQYLEILHEKSPEKQIFINRNIPSNILFRYTYLMANGLLDTSNPAYYSNLAYLIRDSLEIRIKNALGILEIKNNDLPCKITSDVFVNFICKSKKIQMPTSIKKEILRKIFIWANYHIHLGVVLYSWQCLLILDYIRPLFEIGETEHQISIYGSISMEKKYYQEQLQNDLVQYLKKSGNNVTNIVLLKSPECMLV